MSAPTSPASPTSGAMMGNNLKAHLEHLEKQMRDAAADLDFETAARLRDEIKRLRETELADLRRSAGARGREARARSPAAKRASTTRAAQLASQRVWRRRQAPTLPQAGSTRWAPMAPCRSTKPLFAKPSLDDMGPGTDMATPAGAVSRSLFKKQSHDEAHGSDYGLPGRWRSSRCSARTRSTR